MKELAGSEFAPPGRRVHLDGRGTTWIREHPHRTGDPVILLHGLGATAGLNWAGAFARLGQTLRVIGVDHRGHGRGIRTDRFSLEDCADDVAALIAALKLRRPIVVGYSMGGPIATLLWRRHPRLVGSLVLCATSGSFVGDLARRLVHPWIGSTAFLPTTPFPLAHPGFGGVLDLVTPRSWRPARQVRWAMDEISGHDPRSICQAAACLGHFNSAHWLAGIDVPTTVIATNKDRLVPLERQHLLARSIPGAELREIPAGHLCVAGPGEQHFLDELAMACDEMPRLAA